MISYPLASTSWDEAELHAIQQVTNSGMYMIGMHVRLFEEAFAEYMGSSYAVMVNSGSSANLLAVAALFYRSHKPFQIHQHEEVIVPAVSWSTTYFPLYQYGMKLKFVDIDLNTLNYDLNALEQAISDKTRLVVCANLLGNPNDFGAIQAMIGNRDIVMIEDNCESMGALYNHKQAGTFGLMGTYSTFFSHHISTMEGGLIVTDDEELYHILLSLRSHGWTRNLPKHNLVTGNKSDNAFEESFRFVLPGYNVRPLEMSGAVGIEQLKKLPAFLKARRDNALYFQDKFHDHPCFMIQQEIGQSSWFGFSLVLKPGTGISRGDVIAELEAHQIECRPIVAGNFTKNEVVRWFQYEIQDTLKNADWVDQHGLFVGNHHYPIQPQINQLYECLKPFAKCLT